MHRVREENSWFYISYCKARKETRLITVIINQLLGKWALIINESLGEDCGAQWCEIYWVYSVCQGQESTAPLEMSKEQRNTDICVHSRQTELISDVFWPCTWAAGKKAETVSFLSFFLSGVWLQRRGEQWQTIKIWMSTFLIWWLCMRFSHIPGLKQSTRTWLCSQTAFQPS